MTTSGQVRTKQEELFRNFLGRAASMSTNIMFLEGVLKPVSHGDWEYLKPMLGEQVLMSRDDTFTPELDFSMQLIIGMSILRAFAAELYLKALLASEGKTPPHKHDLLVLHDRLDQKSQGLLEGAFQKWLDVQAKQGSSFVQFPSFRSVMERSRNDFVHVRYEETFQEFVSRIQSGVSNLSAAVMAAMAVCLRHPWASEWHDHVSMLGDVSLDEADP